jgi:nicotinamidase-related amidase
MGEGAQAGVSAKEFLDAAEKSGLWGIVHFNDENKALAKHPALLSWMFGDEPDLPAQLPYQKPKAVVQALRNADAAQGDLAVWLEGEAAQHDFITGTWMDQKLAAHQLSEGKWLSCYAEKEIKEYKAKWAFRAPTKATYRLWVREFHKNWASPSWWRIGEGEWQHTDRGAGALDMVKIANVLSVGWVDYGGVELAAGDHVLEVKVNELRTAGKPDQTGNDLMLAIDAILLTTSREPPKSDPRKPQPRTMPDALRAQYEALKAFDASRPVYLNLTASFFGDYQRYEDSDALYRSFIRWTDIVGYDHYPIYGWGRPDKIADIAGVTAKLAELAEKKPVWAILECTNGGQWTSDKMRPPGPGEVKAEVMMAIINGAKGIGYFPHVWKPNYAWCRIPEENQQAMKEINALLKRLTPAILGPSSDMKLEIMSSEVDPVSLTEGDPKPKQWVPAKEVQYAVRAAEDADFVFLVSLGREPRFLQIKLPAACPLVKSVPEGTELAKDSSVFSELLQPLDVRVYHLAKGPKQSQSDSGEPTQRPAEPAMTGRKEALVAKSNETQAAPSPAAIRLRPRYYRLYTEPGVALAEENFRYRTLDWNMPLKEAALISLDVWNYHFARDTLERVDDISRNKIAPLVEACRKGGLQVIHAPASPVAQKQPNWVKLIPEDEKAQPIWPKSPEWPPADFRNRKGEYAQYALPPEPQEAERNRHRAELRDFHPSVKPVGDEAVILSGEELHRLCAKRGILHLIYVGFNTNACVIMRDYGMIAMMTRGYHAILVRDCTTGMETHETKAQMMCTLGTIATLEQFGAFTVTSEELMDALGVKAAQE